MQLISIVKKCCYEQIMLDTCWFLARKREGRDGLVRVQGHQLISLNQKTKYLVLDQEWNIFFFSFVSLKVSWLEYHWIH